MDNEAAGAGALPRKVLGRTGIEVSAIGVGGWPLGGPDTNLGMPTGWSVMPEDVAMAGLECAYELGANLFDTADVYGHGRSERLIGKLARSVPRDNLVLVSKVGYFAGTAAHGFVPGHMRRQLEQSLENLQTDHLDVYFLHHTDFGPQDHYLQGAVDQMRAFREEGLIKAVGMRGPHRFALDRLCTPAELRGDKVARFRAIFEVIVPDVLAVRDNLLTPDQRSEGIFALADAANCGVLINKPLAQGLLTAGYHAAGPRSFDGGDHRSRKRWFTPESGRVIAAGLDRLRDQVGDDPADLIRIVLWSCLMRSDHAAVLVGFTSPEQVQMNLTCLGQRPSGEVVAAARRIMGEVQAQLDSEGQVFLDEATSQSRAPR